VSAFSHWLHCVILAIWLEVGGGLLFLGMYSNLNLSIMIGTGNQHMFNRTKAAFMLAGILSTVLSLVSVFGFVSARIPQKLCDLMSSFHRFIGMVVRKRHFISIYGYFLYPHFVINFAALSFLLLVVSDAAKSGVVSACQESVQNEKSKARCPELVKVTKGIFFSFAVMSLILEFCKQD
jgi:hypothetical protein